MDMRLIIWGVFGGVGFLFFVFLVEFLRRFNRETADVGGTSGVVHGTAAVPVTILRDFSYQQLQIATNGFSKESLLKQGVFSGNIEGESVVIKCVESTLVFQNELEIVSAVASAIPRRFVEILGICREEKIPGILVFKQMPNGDLASALKRGDESMKSSDGECESSDSSSSGSSKPLDWVTRFKIAIGVAEALVFLHHECSPAIIHRDVKSSSILLDEAYEVRLGSFGKACRQQGGGNAYPIYDIYSYGRVALDLISGLDISSGADTVGEAWLQKAVPLMEFKKQEAFVSLVDPHLVLEEDHVKELMLLAVIARSCIDAEQVQHQSMANILQMLQNPAFFLAVVASEC